MAFDLTPRARSRLKARAHHLQTVARMGLAGLSEAFVSEVDRGLADHGLIKVRIDLERRPDRAAAATELSTRTGAAIVQQVGKVLVLWRPKPDEDDLDSRGTPA